MTLADKIAEPQFAGLDDSQVADALNAPDPTLPPVWQAVPAEAARAVLLSRFEWAAVKASRASADAQIAAVADSMVDALTLQASLDLAVAPYRTAITQGMAALVQAGVLSQAAMDALLSLGQRAQSWAEANGVAVDQLAVADARGKPRVSVQEQ